MRPAPCITNFGPSLSLHLTFLLLPLPHAVIALCIIGLGLGLGLGLFLRKTPSGSNGLSNSTNSSLTPSPSTDQVYTIVVQSIDTKQPWMSAMQTAFNGAGLHLSTGQRVAVNVINTSYSGGSDGSWLRPSLRPTIWSPESSEEERVVNGFQPTVLFPCLHEMFVIPHLPVHSVLHSVCSELGYAPRVYPQLNSGVRQVGLVPTVRRVTVSSFYIGHFLIGHKAAQTTHLHDSSTNYPVGIAMFRHMAVALGWPNRPITIASLLNLALNRTVGWASIGQQYASWGRFKLGHGHPQSSNTGRLLFTLGVYSFSKLVLLVIKSCVDLNKTMTLSLNSRASQYEHYESRARLSVDARVSEFKCCFKR